MQIKIDESKSLNRPAWASESKTGMFNAYKHKHNIENGRFTLRKNYYAKEKK